MRTGYCVLFLRPATLDESGATGSFSCCAEVGGAGASIRMGISWLGASDDPPEHCDDLSVAAVS